MDDELELDCFPQLSGPPPPPLSWRAPRLSARTASLFLGADALSVAAARRRGVRQRAAAVEAHEPPALRASTEAYATMLAAGSHVPLELARGYAAEAM